MTSTDETPDSPIPRTDRESLNVCGHGTREAERGCSCCTQITLTLSGISCCQVYESIRTRTRWHCSYRAGYIWTTGALASGTLLGLGGSTGMGVATDIGSELENARRVLTDTRCSVRDLCSLFKATSVCLVPDFYLVSPQIFQNGFWRWPRRSTHDGGLNQGSYSSHGRHRQP